MSSVHSPIAHKMAWDRLRYAQVWEDHRLLEEALCVGPDDDVLSIGSAGCNVLALALLGPRSITAVDMNPTQIALLELKLAAVSELEHEGFACLIGAWGSEEERLHRYHEIRAQLNLPVRTYWDRHEADIRAGVMHAGRLETYFRAFQREHLSELWPTDLVGRLFAQQPLEQQAELFRREAATSTFEQRFRWYFGREHMARNGRDCAQFEHVQGTDVGRFFFHRFCHACTELPLHDNSYMQYFLTGHFHDLNNGPPFLRPSNFERLRRMVSRVRVHCGEIERLLHPAVQDTFSKANLSDIFEYMPRKLSDALFVALGQAIRPGGRIAYWNLLVPRCPPAGSGLQPLPALSERLWRHDRAWFYRAFHVAGVTGI